MMTFRPAGGADGKIIGTAAICGQLRIFINDIIDRL